MTDFDPDLLKTVFTALKFLCVSNCHWLIIVKEEQLLIVCTVAEEDKNINQQIISHL